MLNGANINDITRQINNEAIVLTPEVGFSCRPVGAVFGFFHWTFQLRNTRTQQLQSFVNYYLLTRRGIFAFVWNVSLYDKTVWLLLSPMFGTLRFTLSLLIISVINSLEKVFMTCHSQTLLTLHLILTFFAIIRVSETTCHFNVCQKDRSESIITFYAQANEVALKPYLRNFKQLQIHS